MIKTSDKSKTFRFRESNTDEIKRFIPKKILKKLIWVHAFLKKCRFFSKYICDDINAFIHSSKFHNELHADIVTVQKKKKFSEENYRPISILPNISKVYDRSLYDQMSNYFEVVLLKYQCAFRKGGSAQHFMLVIKEWKK